MIRGMMTSIITIRVYMIDIIIVEVIMIMRIVLLIVAQIINQIID